MALVSRQLTVDKAVTLALLSARALMALPRDEVQHRLRMLVRRTMGRSIYPLELPPLEVRSDLDVLILELPPRYNPMMPNGLGAVAAILKASGVRYQILDANVVLYHRFHSERLHGVAPGDGRIPADPWSDQDVEQWSRPEIRAYFQPALEGLLRQIELRRPKVVGLGIHDNSRAISNDFIRELRRRVPDTVILVGGYDCVYRESGMKYIPDFDYMCVNEADLTLGPLVQALARGERPKDLPGVASRFDTPGVEFVPTPLPHDLDALPPPDYDWTDLSLYRTFDGNYLATMISSRGCYWSRCRFCSECFTYRNRSPQSVADEIEFLASHGFDRIQLSDSDIMGDGDSLAAICEEVMRRKVRVRLMGQLRIHKRGTPEFYRHLKHAGFWYLRFGVDGWSENLVRRQRLGYNMDMVHRCLEAASGAGLITGVNVVVGVPGETEEDIDEAIQHFRGLKSSLHMVEFMHTLMLSIGSEYYNNPEAYGIKFRSDKATLYANHVSGIPVDQWYSDDPYIDQPIRVRRMDRLATALRREHIFVGLHPEAVRDRLESAACS